MAEDLVRRNVTVPPVVKQVSDDTTNCNHLLEPSLERAPPPNETTLMKNKVPAEKVY